MKIINKYHSLNKDNNDTKGYLKPELFEIIKKLSNESFNKLL